MDLPRVTADLSRVSTPDDMPSDVYKYMIQNASSHQRSKLMETGKFFYPKEFVKIDYAVIDQDGIHCYKSEDITVKNVTAKLSQSLWIAEKLHVYQSNEAMIRSLPKTAVWNIHSLCIHRPIMSYENLKFLTSGGGVTYISMEGSQIQYNDDKKEVPLEKMFELLPNCSRFIFFDNAPSIVSLEAANLHRPSAYSIYMYELGEKFDFKTFSTFMINNQNIRYLITFKNNISGAYAKELKCLIVNINQAWKNQAELPTIAFL